MLAPFQDFAPPHNLRVRGPSQKKVISPRREDLVKSVAQKLTCYIETVPGHKRHSKLHYVQHSLQQLMQLKQWMSEWPMI